MKWGDGKRDDGCFFALTKWILTLLVLAFLLFVFGQVALAQGPQETAVPGNALVVESGACFGGFRRSQDPNIVGVFLQQDDNLLALLAPDEVLHFAGRYNRLWLDWSGPGTLDFLVIDSRGFHREDLTAPSWLDLSRASTLRVEYTNVPGNRQTLFYQEVVGGPCQEVPPPTSTPTPSPSPQAVLDAEISCSAALFDLTTNVAGRIEYKLSVNGEEVLAGAWEIYAAGQYEDLAVAWPEPLTGYEPYALDIEAEFVDESGQELDWAHTWTDGVICATPPTTPTPSPQASLTVVPSCAGVRLFGSSEVEADLRYSAMAELTDTLYLQGTLRIEPGNFDKFIPWPSKLDEYGEYHLFVEGLLNGESGLRRWDHAKVDRTCGVPATPPPPPPQPKTEEVRLWTATCAPAKLFLRIEGEPPADAGQISAWRSDRKDNPEPFGASWGPYTVSDVANQGFVLGSVVSLRTGPQAEAPEVGRLVVAGPGVYQIPITKGSVYSNKILCPPATPVVPKLPKSGLADSPVKGTPGNVSGEAQIAGKVSIPALDLTDQPVFDHALVSASRTYPNVLVRVNKSIFTGHNGGLASGEVGLFSDLYRVKIGDQAIIDGQKYIAKKITEMDWGELETLSLKSLPSNLQVSYTCRNWNGSSWQNALVVFWTLSNRQFNRYDFQ